MKRKKFTIFLFFFFSILSSAVLAIMIDSFFVREQYKKIEPNLDNYSMAEMLYLSLEKSKNAFIVDDVNFELQRKVFIGRLRVIEQRTQESESYRENSAFTQSLMALQNQINLGDVVFREYKQKKISKSDVLRYFDDLEYCVLDLQEAIYTIQVGNFKRIQSYVELYGVNIYFLIIISLLCIAFIIVITIKYSAAMERVLQKKNIFISSIYHELAGSTQTIAMVVEFLKEEGLRDEFDEEIELIDYHCNKIFEQTKEIMEYSRFEIGDVKIKSDKVNLNDLILKISDNVSKNGNELRLFCSSVNKTFIADSYKISTIISNLLTNSCKFTEGGVIFLHARYKSGFVYLRIKDNGVGFDVGNGDALYQPFRVGDTKNTKQGLGLGLAIVKNNVDIMKGKIKVRSSVGQGTVFFIQLPLLLIKEEI
ncbi:HAMP domain-containing histidine kinase [Salmonella enterica subsp. enterica serovar Shubra]|nr:HAMP domain-containing histidine kinase [Salmonella enterica subsp. enterica serovar Shubra]